MQRRIAGPVPDDMRLPSFANAFHASDRERYVSGRAQRIEADTDEWLERMRHWNLLHGMSEEARRTLAREIALSLSGRYEQGAQDAFDEMARRSERLDV